MENPRGHENRPMVTGVFRDRESAEYAIQTLERRGYSRDEVHLLMSDRTREQWFGKDKTKVKEEHGNKALEGAGIGAGTGAAVGATLVGIAAAASAVTIPGLGLLIAGPLAGALAGAGAGSVAGGLVGALVGAGIPEDKAKLYEKDLREGGVVLGVHPRNEQDAEFIEREWSRIGEHVYR